MPFTLVPPGDSTGPPPLKDCWLVFDCEGLLVATINRSIPFADTELMHMVRRLNGEQPEDYTAPLTKHYVGMNGERIV